jgi:glyoxylate reductase
VGQVTTISLPAILADTLLILNPPATGRVFHAQSLSPSARPAACRICFYRYGIQRTGRNNLPLKKYNRIYVTTSEIPPEAVEILESVGKVTVNPTPTSPYREVLMNKVRGVQGLLSLVTDRVDSALMDEARELKVVANMAVGYDNIDLRAATERSIMVTNTPDVLSETTADTTMMLTLAVARRLSEADRYVRKHKWTAWTPNMMLGRDVHGKTLGIYGLGRIGEEMVKRARGFDMKVIYHNRRRRPDLERKYGVRYKSLDGLLIESDFLTIHAPLTQETRHSIGAKELSLMKRTAYLVNTSRGSVVDEAALIKALQYKVIAGAALDVFENEPVSADNPLLSMDNVVVTPHIGSASIETRTAMAVAAAQNIVAALKGETPPDLVNKELARRKAAK